MIRHHRAGFRLRIAFLVMIAAVAVCWLGLPASDVQSAGATEWEQPLELTAGIEGRHVRPVIASDPFGGLHVVWTFENPVDANFTDTAVYYATWGGQEWSKPIDIFANGARDPQIVVDSLGYVHVVFLDAGAMYHTKKHISAPTGATSWPRPSVIQDGYFTSPYLAIDSDQVMHLTYRRHGNDDRGVYYQQSKDGGETWTYPSRISAPVGTMVPMGPSHFHTYVLPEQNGMLQAVWTDEFSDSPGLYYSRSLDEGVTWETPTKVGTGAWITIARDRDGVLHMLWHTTMEASCERHEMISLDDGATWRDRGRVLRPLEGCLGWMHLPVDSSQDLYMVSIGRVPPTGEIGMWESWWQGDWGTVLRIIPSVSVTDGPDWFDHGPDQSRLAVSLGNRLNLAWFTNDGRIWYSSTETNAPRVPPITLPAALPEPQAAALSPGEEKPLEVTPEPLPAARSEQLPVDIAPASSTSPVSTLILGVLPAMVLVLAVAFLNLRARR